MIHPEDQIIEIISKVMDEISATSARLGPDEIPSHDETMRMLRIAIDAFVGIGVVLGVLAPAPKSGESWENN